MDPIGSGADARPNRWRRRMPIALIGVVALAAGAFIGLGLRTTELNRWKSSSERYRDESANLKAQADKSGAEMKSLQARADGYQTGWQTTGRALADLQHKVENTVGDLDHPTFVTWNLPTQLTPGHYLVASVPDTFTFNARVGSTASIKLMIMDVTDFACWHTHACASHWVEWSSFRSPTVPFTNPSLKSGGPYWIDAVFHKAEGCASYVAVITGSGHITPIVSVTFRPARHTTGTCR
jgi:hypothetical protein